MMTTISIIQIASDMSKSSAQNSSPLDWRFVTGKITSKSKDVVHLETQISLPPQKITARLAINPQQIDNYSYGEQIKLFIAKPAHSHEQHNHPLWHVADGKMADSTQNPWMLEQIHNGDAVEGIVSRYVEDYAVIVDLTHNLTQEITWPDLKEFTAFLHIKETPDAALSRDIRQLLHVGDCVQAIITSIDFEEINIHLSVSEWLEIRKQELEQLSDHASHKASLLQTVLEPPITRAEKNLLLVDDDIQFCNDMQRLLRHWQIKVRFCRDLHGLSKELSQQYFDACLMDCNLGLTEEEQKAMLKLLEKHPKIQVARMTGEEHLFDQDQLLLKPLRIPKVLAWLDSGEIPVIDLTQTRLLFNSEGRRWRAQGSEMFVVERAKQLLQRCCDKTQACKALWVKEERSGYFAIRVAYQINENICKQLEKYLQISHIATAIETGESMEVIDRKSGPLQEILGDFGFVFIMPFSSDGKYDRAVAFFSNIPFDKKAQKYLLSQQEHMADITYLMNATQELESNEVFVTQGMLLSSTVHEFRTAASTVSGFNLRLQELLARPAKLINDNSLREEVNAMVMASEHLLELSENGLNRIRSEQQSIQDLRQLLENTLHLMRGRMYSLEIPPILASLNCALDYSVSLPYPSKNIEIPLINLLDNALLQCKARSWARVEVTLLLDTSCPDMPILIQIEDTGLGMTAEQRKNLFTARKTSRGIAGSGMGLFLSKQLLEAIGGQIELAKTVRWIGSRFNIRLPN